MFWKLKDGHDLVRLVLFGTVLRQMDQKISLEWLGWSSDRYPPLSHLKVIVDT